VCDQDNCGLPFSLHIRTEAQTTESELITWLQDAKPRVVCNAGHEIGQNMYPVSIETIL
jgi:hypothetical protein